MPAQQVAASNFEHHIRQNPYPGRGIVVGLSSAQDAWLMIYWIMGRSAGSRNRKFVVEGGSLRTEPVDARLLTDPSLIIYEAMLEQPGLYWVSNGAQTRALLDGLQAAPGGPRWIQLTPHLIAQLRRPVPRQWTRRAAQTTDQEEHT